VTPGIYKNAGVVHEDIEPNVLSPNQLHDTVTARVVRDIHLHRRNVEPLGAELLSRFLPEGEIAASEENLKSLPAKLLAYF
jgi:hypothetical protein